VVYGVPLGGFGTAVVFSVGAEAEGSDWSVGGSMLFMQHHILMAEAVPLTLPYESWVV
jgi:hypothetical protein